MLKLSASMPFTATFAVSELPHLYVVHVAETWNWKIFVFFFVRLLYIGLHSCYHIGVQSEKKTDFSVSEFHILFSFFTVASIRQFGPVKWIEISQNYMQVHYFTWIHIFMLKCNHFLSLRFHHSSLSVRYQTTRYSLNRRNGKFK